MRGRDAIAENVDSIVNALCVAVLKLNYLSHTQLCNDISWHAEYVVLSDSVTFMYPDVSDRSTLDREVDCQNHRLLRLAKAVTGHTTLCVGRRSNVVYIQN